MPARRPTARETEIKLRIADVNALRRVLRRFGATSRGRVLEQNTLYDTPKGDLRRRSRLLRLRIETPAGLPGIRGGSRRAMITAKAPVRSAPSSRYKEKLEREREAPLPRRWPGILRALGMQPAFRYEKYRTAYRLAGLHLDLDETPVGDFLEIEGLPRAINRAARALGFSPRDYIRGTYWDLYAADCRRRGRFPGNMLLQA
jgi:adenylate cyclase, class 2